MNKLNQKLAAMFKKLSQRNQSIVINALITAIGVIGFISTLGAEQHIMAP
jgi:hypothetical protein